MCDVDAGDDDVAVAEYPSDELAIAVGDVEVLLQMLISMRHSGRIP